jgi:acyl dehydratase
MATASVSGRSYDDISVGDEITQFVVALTSQRMVMDVAVMRDFAPIHHDREIAQAHGAPDMFVNTLFLQSVYEAAARQWAGLDPRVVSMRFRMLTFNCAGEMLTAYGRVADKSVDDDGRRLVKIEMWTDTDRSGTTTRGEIVIAY